MNEFVQLENALSNFNAFPIRDLSWLVSCFLQKATLENIFHKQSGAGWGGRKTKESGDNLERESTSPSAFFQINYLELRGMPRHSRH